MDLGAPTAAEGCASFTAEVRDFRGGVVRNDVSFPHASTIRFSFPARGKMPPCDVYWYDGGMRPRTPDALIAEGKQLPPRGTMFVGDEGVIIGGYYYEGARIIPTRRMRQVAGALKAPDVKTASSSDEWIGAFRGGKPSRGDFHHAQHVAEAICLGNIAVRLSTRLEWDAASMKITNNRSANKYLRRTEYRKGWEL